MSVSRIDPTKRRVDPIKLMELRVEKDWYRVQLAKHSGVSLSYLKYIESGERHPSTIIAKKIAKALGVTIDAFSTPWEDEPVTRRRAS